MNPFDTADKIISRIGNEIREEAVGASDVFDSLNLRTIVAAIIDKDMRE